MSIEGSTSMQAVEKSIAKPEVNRYERHRLIAHLGKTFMRRYDIQVLPSRQKGLWACALDPKIYPELQRYIEGERDTLDDLPKESFIPKRILYDEQSASEMSMEEITTLLHHEAGHGKFTDFPLMFQGQRRAKDDGYLPTSFWLTFEGFEDPRVNSLEGEESPAIDRQIRANQGKDLQKRITEAPLSQKPKMLQFAYNSFHSWLYGEGITELKDTDVGKAGEVARPLLEQYFQNTDVEERRILQNQIWDIAKSLEKKDIEDEKKRQMAKKKGMSSGKGQGGQGQSGQPQAGSGEGEQSSSQSGQGEGEGLPQIPGGTDTSGSKTQDSRDTERKNFLQRLKDKVFGQKNKEDLSQSKADYDFSKGSKKNSKSEKLDLSKLTPEDLQEIQDAIDRLSPEERVELEKIAREAVDEEQKEALEKELGRSMEIKKNKKTGEYEVSLRVPDETSQKNAEKDFQDAVERIDKEDQQELEREDVERRGQVQILRQKEKERQEKFEMEKAGFDENERDKFLLYQALEDSMHSQVRNFKQAIEKVIPRKKEGVYEGGFFSGPKFDKTDLVKKAPLGNEQFWQRQVERAIGEPRLFIGLVVDNSGSMAGKKIEEARKTIIFFAKVCRDMGVPFMGTAFGTNAEVIKEFKQDFDNPKERIKPKIIDATNASASSTNIHAGIEVTIEAMNNQRRLIKDSHGLIFVLTDGGANRGKTGEELKNYIEENRGKLTFKGFGLSGNSSERSQVQSYLNYYFGESNCAYPQGFEDLPDEAFRVLRINLMQFQRFLS